MRPFTNYQKGAVNDDAQDVRSILQLFQPFKIIMG